MRKDARVFKPAPPVKSNSMKLPDDFLEQASTHNNIQKKSSFAKVPFNNNAPPISFDIDRFQHDLKSNDELQKVYAQFIQFYNDGKLIQPQNGNKGKGKKKNGRKPKNQRKVSYNCVQDYSQEGPNDFKNKNTEEVENTLGKKTNEQYLLPQSKRYDNNSHKVHSANNSPNRYVCGLFTTL